MATAVNNQPRDPALVPQQTRLFAVTCGFTLSQSFPTLFGESRDKNVAFVIDTSEGMHSHLEAVKHHLTETLLAKARARDSLFNIVEFSYKVTKWCDRMVTCYMDTVYGALGWVRSLCCKPGRDLLGALQAAFDDPACQAVYLVTNGLPQSNPEEVLHAVSSVSQQRPVHVFCLADKWTGSEGQDFLRALAQCTRGSCHLVTLNTADLTQVVPVYTTERWGAGPLYSDVKYCSALAALDRPFSSVPSVSFCHLPLGHPRYHPAISTRYMLDGFVPTCPISSCEGADILGGSLCSSPLLIGTRVLARREPDGYYYLGTIKQEVEGRDVFLVDFDKPVLTAGKYQTTMQKTNMVDIVHYTEALRHNIVPGDKVLAPWEADLTRYGPGSVLSGVELRDPLRDETVKEIRVRFWNGKEAKVPKGVTLWISPALHERVVKEIHEPLTARRALLQNTWAQTEMYAYRAMPLCYHGSPYRCHGLSCFCHYTPYKGFCCVPTHHSHSCLHQSHGWWPLRSDTRLCERDLQSEDLEKKVSRQLQELRASKETISLSSSASSLSEEDSPGLERETKPARVTVVNRAINTDSSLLDKERSPSPDRPGWRYWKRCHPEPQHRKPESCVSSRVKSRSGQADVNSPEHWPAGPTNHSAMFKLVPHSPGRRITVKDVLAPSDFKPTVGKPSCEKCSRKWPSELKIQNIIKPNDEKISGTKIPGKFRGK